MTAQQFAAPGLGSIDVYGTTTQTAAQVHMDPDDHMWGGDGWGWGWITMIVMMGLFWAGVIGVAAWGISVLGRRDHGGPARGGGRAADDALEIARQRYARGEINADEFDEIRRRLG